MSDDNIIVGGFCMIAVLSVVCKYVNGTAPIQALLMFTMMMLYFAPMLGRMPPLPAGFVVLFLACATIRLPVDEVWYFQRPEIAGPMQKCLVCVKVANECMSGMTPAPSFWDYVTRFGYKYDPKNLTQVAAYFGGPAI